MLERLIFPSLTGKWLSHVQLAKYADLLAEDFDDETPDYPFLNPEIMGDWIKLLHKTLGYDYSWGGYLEDRRYLLDGTYLPADGRIHLGVDYWVPEETPVYLPTKAKLVRSMYDNDLNGGWGGQAIFEINGMYVIFGHLKNLITNIIQEYAQGTLVGIVAPIGEFSGGWYPHLHLQCMKDFNPNVDGYAANHVGMIQRWFPDPVEFLSSCTKEGN